MKCLVTGGAGFIGSHLCKKLISDGNEVFCIDNFITGSKSNIENLTGHSSFTLIEADITKPISNFKFLHGRQAGQTPNLDAIYHLASPASPNSKVPKSYVNLPIETLSANSFGTYHLLELARGCGATFLFASSSEVYGDPKQSPQKETYWGNVNPIGVRSVYDEGKRFGEALTMAYVRKIGLDARIARIFNTYGENMQRDGRVVSNFITQALARMPITVYGDGSQTRSFCYVSDLVEGLVLAMESKKTKGEVINLGNANEQTILELATMIKTLCGSSSNIVFEELPQDDPKRRCPDTGKAKALLGWEPKISIEKGLERTIASFKENSSK